MRSSFRSFHYAIDTYRHPISLRLSDTEARQHLSKYSFSNSFSNKAYFWVDFVPPIRSLETLHNQLSHKQVDVWLDMSARNRTRMQSICTEDNFLQGMIHVAGCRLHVACSVWSFCKSKGGQTFSATGQGLCWMLELAKRNVTVFVSFLDLQIARLQPGQQAQRM